MQLFVCELGALGQHAPTDGLMQMRFGPRAHIHELAEFDQRSLLMEKVNGRHTQEEKADLANFLGFDGLCEYAGWRMSKTQRERKAGDDCRCEQKGRELKA